jgi:hypothetical protein
MRRPPQPIQNRRAQPLIRNSFCNDKIDIGRIELAQIAKQIRRRFAQVLFLAQLANRDKLQGAAVSRPPFFLVGACEVVAP